MEKIKNKFDGLKNGLNNMVLKAKIENIKEECQEADSDNILAYKIMKLGEECGEVNAAFLALIGAANKSKSAVKEAEEKGKVLALTEEVLDVILVAEDILYKLKKDFNELDDKVIKELELKKYEKWNKKIKEKQEDRNDK